MPTKKLPSTPSRFWTGLVPLDSEAKQAEQRGAGWRTVLAPAPPPWQLENSGRFVRRGIFIEATSATSAQKALDLVWAAYSGWNDGYLPLDDYPELTETDNKGKSPLFRGDDPSMSVERWGFSGSGIGGAVRLAATVSRRREFTNALYALVLSQGLACIHQMSLDPSHWRHGPAVSPYPRDHFRFAYAIIAAYSTLEHLGLGVQASTHNPSRPQGKWNPVVRTDLERRLVAKGVNLQETALWTIRGTPRRMDRQRPTAPIRRAEWAWGRIRDEEVAVVDAIADLSWLRSRVASHKLGPEAPTLTGYDVANAQYLARRLLLESVGMWRAAPPPEKSRHSEQSPSITGDGAPVA